MVGIWRGGLQNGQQLFTPGVTSRPQNWSAVHCAEDVQFVAGTSQPAIWHLRSPSTVRAQIPPRIQEIPQAPSQGSQGSSSAVHVTRAEVDTNAPVTAPFTAGVQSSDTVNPLRVLVPN